MGAEGRTAVTTGAALAGVLVVDKPQGFSSHDVIRMVRRALYTRSVGHAGTLDPMASGVLVVGVGEGTKLLHHLTGDDKTYLATISLGSETDTLDADGVVTQRAEVAMLTDARVAAAAQRFVGEIAQVAPAVSAIKQGGVALHERVRRGESVTPPERRVRVHSLDVLAVRERAIDLRVHSGKGFYVRSLARDLSRALGTCGHLSALRRVGSGAFVVDEALELSVVQRAQQDPVARDELMARLLPLSAALRGVASVSVDPAGVIDIRHGRAIVVERVIGGAWPSEGVQPVAITDGAGTLVALGRMHEGRIEVVRGIL